MKNQIIIDWKIASLANNDNSELTDEMESFLQSNRQLQEELLFIEHFWTNDVKPLVMPSDKLNANFYQMLSRAQSAQQQTMQPRDNASSYSKEQTLSLMDKVKSWFMPTSIAQFATLTFVFVLGFNLNQAPNIDRNSDDFSVLQQDISSLTTVIAMSMLQKDSASERLSGVAYSRQTDLSNPRLVEQLIALLARDKSTSVRLAIIKSLSELKYFRSSEQQLFNMTIKEENVLVQIELCRLLLNYGSDDIKKLFTEQVTHQQLKPEVQEFIKAQSLASYI
ncbi:MAG: HEAT repeat domain-containing protein [Colwellia sp.]|nr:HEAT repeat domain-containing protein [Colwellia sp.]